MKVLPRRYEYCIHCDTTTVQWLVSITFSRSRSSWGPRGPMERYRCADCGTEHY